MKRKHEGTSSTVGTEQTQKTETKQTRKVDDWPHVAALGEVQPTLVAD